jgi:hypothetical protein
VELRRGRPTVHRRTGLRAVLAGLVLLGAVGSCELPKPKLPSIGSAPGTGLSLSAVIVAGQDGRTR